jgi:WhiB family redox-sensing transcriptional regulator
MGTDFLLLAINTRRPCQDVDPETFFPEGGGDNDKGAKRICSPCPLRAECLAYALDNGMQGVWGGTTERDREKIRNGIRRPTKYVTDRRRNRIAALRAKGWSFVEIGQELGCSKRTAERLMRPAA